MSINFVPEKVTPPQSFAELFDTAEVRNESLEVGEIITAEVVRIDRNFVVVDAGLKSESYVPVEEFKNVKGEVEVQEGDFVSVAVEAFENGYGDTILSRDRARRLATWLNLEKAMEAGELVTGTINGRVRGGLTVIIDGLRAFLPGSLIELRPIKDTSAYEGQTLEFKVIKLDRKRNNVVLSRRAVIETELSEKRNKIMESMTEGSIVTGTVKNIADYGAFVDLGSIDGLLHITDLAWRRIRHPSELLTLGQEISAKVLKFDYDKNRISLGLKQITGDPWIGVSRRYPKGTRLFGKVSNITDYGAFVQIEDGVEGLVHLSEMDWSNKNTVPSKMVQMDDEVEIMILDVDEDRRRMSFGMKQCKPNPWVEFAENHKKGDRLTCPVRSITDFGVFVSLDGAIDGLIHHTDIAWNEAPEASLRQFKKGQEVEVVILSIDAERERISLGIKQLSDDPFGMYAVKHDKGQVVTGTVKSVEPRGVVVELAENVTGYLRASEISADRVEDATTKFSEGDSVEAVIHTLDRKARSIQLSIRQKDHAETKQALKKMSEENSQVGTNLGALLKAKMDESES